MTEPAPHAISDYLAELDTRGDGRRAKVAALYERAQALVGEAQPGISYGMPALLYRGKGLLSVMTTRKHIGVYPFSSLAIDAIRERLEVAGIPSAKGAIQLPNDIHFPAALFKDLITTRVAQIDRRG